jgi:hypothetical protein
MSGIWKPNHTISVAGLLSFVAVVLVPKADSHDFKYRPLSAVVRKAKAVTRIAISHPLTWLTASPRPHQGFFLPENTPSCTTRA